MKPDIQVFYDGTLQGEYTEAQFRYFRVSCDHDMYNDAYVYWGISKPIHLRAIGWARMDGVFLTASEVPTTVRALQLLLS